MPIRELIDAQREIYLKREDETLRRLVRSYTRIYASLSRSARALVEQLQDRKPTKSEILRMGLYADLLSRAREELTRFAAVLEEEVLTGQEDVAQLGLSGGRELVTAAVNNNPSIMGTFNVVAKPTIEAMIARLQENSPLRKTLARFGDVDAIGDTLLQGLMSGRHPTKVAAELRRALGVPLTDALRIARTEMIRAYRESNLASYRANPHIVKAWKWACSWDDRVCGSCLALDGTIFPLEESLDDHPNGRCWPEPVTVTYKEMGIDAEEFVPEQITGEQWFTQLPEGRQRLIMGAGKYEAWKDGKFEFSALAHEEHDEEWGRMFREASLKELV